jgi:hypothetical protein
MKSTIFLALFFAIIVLVCHAQNQPMAETRVPNSGYVSDANAAKEND